MNEADQRLAQAATIGAADLEHRGYLRAGVFRQLARRVIELANEVDQLRVALNMPDTTTGNPCPTCLGPVIQAGRGRPRIYCSECSPRKKAGNGGVVS